MADHKEEAKKISAVHQFYQLKKKLKNSTVLFLT